VPGTVQHVLTATTPDNTSYEIRPSHWNSGHAVTFAAVGSEVSGAFSNGGNVTFGLSANGYITASAPAGGGGALTISGAGSSISNGQLVFSNSNGVSFGMNGSTMTASVAAVPTSYVSQINGSSGSISLGVSSSLSAQTIGNTIVFGLASNITTALQSAGAYLTTAAQSSASNVSAVYAATNNTGGGTATLSGGLSFTNANSVTFYTSAGNAIAASFSTSQSVQTQASGNIPRTGFSTTTTAGSVLVGTHDTAGLSLGVPAWLTAAAGGGDGYNIVSMLTSTSGGGTLGATFSALSGSIGLMAGSNITLSQTSNTINIIGPAPGTVQNFNTAITGGASITFNTSGFSFNGLDFVGSGAAITGNASITANSQGLSFNGSGLAGTGTTTSGGNFAMTLNSVGLNFDGRSLAGTTTAVTGNATVTLNSGGFRLNATNLAGTGSSLASTTGTAGMNFVINSTGLTITQPVRTRYLYPDGMPLTTIGAFGNATMTLQYVDIANQMSGTRLDAFASMSFVTSAGAGTQTYQFSQYAVIYTKNASTLSSLSSGSTQTTYTLASNTAGQTQLVQGAIRPISVPINFSMGPGEYYVGFNIVTANTAGSGGISMVGGAMLNNVVFAEMSAATATSTNMYGGMGIYSAATTGTVAAVSLSAINQTGTAWAQANIMLMFRNA